MLDKRLIKEAKAVKAYLALTVGLGLGISILAVFQARYLAQVVARVFLQEQDLQAVKGSLMLVLGIVFLRAVLQYAAEATAHEGAAVVKESLRLRLIDRLLELGPVYVGGERTGEIVNVLTEGIDSLEEYFARYLPQVALAGLIPIMILGFVFPLDITTGIILLLTAPLIPVFMILIGKLAHKKAEQQWQGLSRMSAHFLDVLQGLTTLKVFSRSIDQIRVIARVSDNFRKTTLGVLRIAFLSALVLEFMATISTALVAVSLGLRLIEARIGFQEAFFLLLLAPELYQPLRALGSQFHASLSGVGVANRIYEILETVPSHESKDAGEKKANMGFSEESGQQVQDKLQSAGIEFPIHIAFEEVYFRFEPEGQNVLNGVSFELKPNEQVALVGLSGAGKSTITQLLLKFLEPEKGIITVNGIPLKNLAPEYWRQHVAYIPQHPYLFAGTIYENIRMGRSEASREDLIRAARLAEADDFIRELPHGYDTVIGERGVRLSGGQVQRLAIARAFLKDAPVLILDEITSGLDPANEELIQEAVKRLTKGRTVLIIAHSLHTIYRADRILVLNDGKVAEEGRHQELIHKEGLYYRLATEFGGEGA